MSNIKNWLNDNNINQNSISFYSDKDGIDQNDVDFGVCDITNREGNLVTCTALTSDGDIVEFQALESLVSGALGKIAGAF